jgi:hypothetical protein
MVNVFDVGQVDTETFVKRTVALTVLMGSVLKMGHVLWDVSQVGKVHYAQIRLA